jgi:hypothetical protein
MLLIFALHRWDVRVIPALRMTFSELWWARFYVTSRGIFLFHMLGHAELCLFKKKATKTDPGAAISVSNQKEFCTF